MINHSTLFFLERSDTEWWIETFANKPIWSDSDKVFIPCIFLNWMKATKKFWIIFERKYIYKYVNHTRQKILHPFDWKSRPCGSAGPKLTTNMYIIRAKCDLIPAGESFFSHYLGSLVLDCSNYNALATELLQSCIRSIYFYSNIEIPKKKGAYWAFHSVLTKTKLYRLSFMKRSSPNFELNHYRIPRNPMIDAGIRHA